MLFFYTYFNFHNINIKRILSLTRKKLLVLYLLGSIFIISSAKISDYDIWYHLKSGEYIVKTKSIPHSDIFSFTAPCSPWITHEWLSQVIFYQIYSWFSFPGLIITKALLITLTFYFLFLLVKRYCSLLMAVVITFLSALISGGSFLERPQLFSYLFLTLFYGGLILYQEENKKYLYYLPFLVLLWVNMHSSFLLVPTMLLILVLSSTFKIRSSPPQIDLIKFYLLLIIISIFISLFNPNTYQILFYPFHTIFNPMHTEYIVEWQSPNFHKIQTLIFEFYLILLIITFALSYNRVKIEDLLFFLLFTHLSLSSVRHFPLFAIISAPILAKYINSLLGLISTGWGDLQERSSLLKNLFFRLNKIDKSVSYEIYLINWGLLILLIFICLSHLPKSPRLEDCIVKDDFPVGAVKFIKEKRLPPNMFNDYDWGGFLIFTLYPDYKVFIDGRADVYADEIMPWYLKVVRFNRGWLDILKKHKVKFLLIKSDSPLRRFLEEREDFKRVYLDKSSVIFVLEK